MQPLFHLLFEIFRHLICCQKTLFKQILFSVQSPPHMMKQPPTDELLFQVRITKDLKEKKEKMLNCPKQWFLNFQNLAIRQ